MGVSEALTTVGAVVVGWYLSERGQRGRDRRAAARERYADLVRVYSSWIRGVRERFRHWTSETSYVEMDLTGVELELNFLERDDEGRRLRMAVWATLPDCYTDEYERMKFERNTETGPDDSFEWPAFDAAMTAVMAYVKRSNPDARRARWSSFLDF